MNDVAAYGALIISFLTMAAAAVRYFLEKQRKDRVQDIDGIDKLLARIEILDGVIAELQAGRDRDFHERAEIRKELWAAQNRIYHLERKQQSDETEREGLKRLLVIALEYIDTLSNQIVKDGGRPVDKPQEIIKWLHDNNGGTKQT